MPRLTAVIVVPITVGIVDIAPVVDMAAICVGVRDDTDEATAAETPGVWELPATRHCHRPASSIDSGNLVNKPKRYIGRQQIDANAIFLLRTV